MSAAATQSIRWRVSTSVAHTQEWATPLDLYLALHHEFSFTLDAAAGESNAKCVRFYDKDTDALEISWGAERIFLNPPYGKDLNRWLAKARYEAIENGALVVLLLPARTGTRWFHRHVLPFAEIRFLQGRLNYVRGGRGGRRAPFDSMIVVFHPNDVEGTKRRVSSQPMYGRLA